MQVVTRFAPSPTGDLHIGSVRTAIFNYIFAKKNNGKFLLRIEDTDKKRSTQESTDIILEAMKWLNLQHDDEIVYQSQNIARHQQIAQKLLAKGAAYYCYCSPEEIDQLRQKALDKKENFIFRSPWRDSTQTPPAEIKPVIRLKAPQEGEMIINDQVQGEIKVKNNILDDMIILRSDGTPTYMLSVVVDDYDMGVTHVIRGDDHLNNAFRQNLIYQAMEWKIPTYAHIPLIHGDDGAKLSKRHGATNIMKYKEMGYLPEALNNYLMHLGWSAQDNEFLDFEQAAKIFELKQLVKSPARFDSDKLMHINQHYIKQITAEQLPDILMQYNIKITPEQLSRLQKGLSGILERSVTVNELIQVANFYMSENIEITPEIKAEKFTTEKQEHFKNIISLFEKVENWQEDELKTIVKNYCKEQKIKMGLVGELIRISLTGSLTSPSIFEMLYAFGKKESINRLQKQAAN